MIVLFNRARASLPRRSLRERLTLLGLAVFFASFGIIGARAITESTNETLRERLASAQATAQYIEAMTSNRAYRKAMPAEQAQAILEEGAGRQWDPRVVEAFVRAKGGVAR